MLRRTLEARSHSAPDTGSNSLLLFADGIGIDGGNFHDGVAYPLGEKIQRNAFVKRMVATIRPMEGSRPFRRHAECPKATDTIIEAKHHEQFDAFLLPHHLRPYDHFKF